MLERRKKDTGVEGPFKEGLSGNIESVGNSWDENFGPTAILEELSTIRSGPAVRTSPTNSNELSSGFLGLRWLQHLFYPLSLLGVVSGVLYSCFKMVSQVSRVAHLWCDIGIAFYHRNELQ
jgi:hypothetical protein